MNHQIITKHCSDRTLSISKKLCICLLSLFLTACHKPDNLNDLTIQLNYGDEKISCSSSLPGITKWQLSQLQFYLSNFTLDGKALNLDNTQYQGYGTVLLGDTCENYQPGNWTITFSKPLTAGELSFDLGVPFNVNHSNPLSLESPLNQSDMFWNWQLGHKFLRLDMRNSALNSENQQTGWHFHLGSTGCTSASVMRAPKTSCKKPNRFNYKLDLQGDVIILDIKPLLKPIFDQQQLLSKSCMSENNTKTCKALFSSLKTQQLWRVK